MSIAIREIGIGDESMVHEMLDAVTPEWVDHLAPGASGPRAFVATPSTYMFCAYVDNEPAGFAWGMSMRHPHGRLTSYLHQLDVAEQFRRRGIGTMLVDASMDFARRSGHDRFWLSTGMHNEIAQGLYDKLGGEAKELGDRNYWWDLT